MKKPVATQRTSHAANRTLLNGLLRYTLLHLTSVLFLEMLVQSGTPPWACAEAGQCISKQAVMNRRQQERGQLCPRVPRP